MKKISIILIALSLSLICWNLVYGSEGHDRNAAAGLSFGIDGANVTLKLDPETYQTDRIPKVVIALTDTMWGCGEGDTRTNERKKCHCGLTP